MQVEMFQAKRELSELIASLEKHEQNEIYIARDGIPVAVLKLYQPEVQKRKLGKFNGKYFIPDVLADDNEVTKLIGESSLSLLTSREND